jgi:hypothetical protein
VSDADDLPAALAEVLSNQPVVGRLRNITSGAKTEDDPVEDQGAAWALTALPEILFPGAASGAVATDVLLELASLAKPAPDKPPLLPARVHMLFRGLPGLWACANPQCDQIDADLRGGPTGKLYSEPRRACGCGAQILELHSCRSSENTPVWPGEPDDEIAAGLACFAGLDRDRVAAGEQLLLPLLDEIVRHDERRDEGAR